MCCNSWWVGWGWMIIYIWLDSLSLLLDIIGDSLPDMLHCLFCKRSWRPAILPRNLVQLAPDQSFCWNKFSASQIRDVFPFFQSLRTRSLSNHVVSHRRGSQKLSQTSWIFNDSAPRTDAKAETCHKWMSIRQLRQMCWDLPPTRVPVEVHGDLMWFVGSEPGGPMGWEILAGRGVEWMP